MTSDGGERELQGYSVAAGGDLAHPSVHMVFKQDGRSRISGPAGAKFSVLLKDKGGVFAVKFDENVQLANEIVYAVAKDREILKVEDLVDRYARNKPTLQRLFAKYVGVSPKWVIQRYRLHEAAEQLAADDSISQVDLALSLGYSDQAHFVRDFKAVVGVSPAAYAKAARQGD